MGFGSGALGEFPYAGEAGTFTPHSVPDPLPGLLSDPTAPRVFLLRATPTGGNVDVASEDVYTDGKAFQSALPAPHNFQVSLPAPDLVGGAGGAVSNLEISNPDALLDTIAAHDWLGADAPVYMGPRGDLRETDYTLFTRIFAGVSEGIEYSPDVIRLLMRDFRFRLTRRLETERFMGTGACLRFDGSADYVDYGDILDQGAGDSFAVEILFKTTSTGGNRTLASKVATFGVPGPAGWRINFNSADNLVFLVSDGTDSAVANVNDTTAYRDGKWHRATLVLDRTTDEVRSYVDGELMVTTDASAVGSLSNSASLFVSNSGASFNGDLDDFRFWSIVPTDTDIADRALRELLGSEAGLEIYSKFNEGDLSTASDSSGNGRDGTITGAAWVGSLEGDAAIAGLPKPRGYGVRRQVAPRLVDAQRLVYQVHARSMQAINAVRDSGDDLTKGSEVSDIYSAVPAGGSYNVARTATGTYIRLGSSPVGEVTLDFEGDDSGALGYQDTAGGIARKLLTEDGEITDPDGLDVASFTALDTLQPATVGHYWDEDINIDEAVDDALAGALSWWGPTREAKVQVGRMGDATALTPTVFWTLEDDLVELTSVQPLRTRAKEVRVSYRPYHETLDADAVASGVPDATRDDFGKEVRWATARAPSYSTLPDDAATIEVHSAFDTFADAYAEAKRWAEWLSQKVKVYTLRPELGSLAFYLGTVANLTSARYDLGGGRNMIIFGIVENVGTDADADTVEVLAVGI